MSKSFRPVKESCQNKTGEIYFNYKIFEKYAITADLLWEAFLQNVESVTQWWSRVSKNLALEVNLLFFFFLQNLAFELNVPDSIASMSEVNRCADKKSMLLKIWFLEFSAHFPNFESSFSVIKGGESFSQFRWFTTAKTEL